MARQVQASELKTQITVQTEDVAINTLGEPVQTWVDYMTILAQVQPLRGREYFAAGQMQAPQDVRFRIRYRPGVTETMRVLWKGEPHAINAVINVDGENLTLELMCTNGLRDGR